MYILNIGLNESNLSNVFQSVANHMASIAGEYNSNHDFDDFKGRLRVVTEEWKLFSDTWAQIVDLAPWEVMIITPGNVIIAITKHRIHINFGRDSESLSKAIINAVSAYEVDLHDGAWNRIEKRVQSPSY